MIRPFSSRKAIQRPPGPTGKAAFSASLRARRDPLGLAEDLVDRYGDVVAYRFGRYRGYLLRHPDHIQQVLHSRRTSYTKENFNYDELRTVLGDGLISSEGSKWVEARRAIQPMFHRKRIDRMAPVIVQSTMEMLERWDAAIDRDEAIDVQHEMTALSLRIATQTVFGMDVGADASTAIMQTFERLNAEVTHRFRHPFAPPRWVPTPRNRAFRRALEGLNKVVDGIIEERRTRRADSIDLVDLLQNDCTRPTRSRIRDHAVTLILAGYETTAALLSWTWYLLSLYPRCESRVRSEVANFESGTRGVALEDIDSLPYLHSVVKEALRLFPPVWILSRRAEHDDRLGAYDVPAGTVVTLCTYLAHRHPTFWHRPAAFHPERFLTDGPDRHACAYLPFGAGHRQCIGGHLAMMESMLVLGTVLQHYEPVSPDGTTRPPGSDRTEALVTLRPRGVLHARRRNP